MNWYAKNSAGGHQGMVVEESAGRTVAVAYDPKDTALLAAAPELLTALSALEQEMQRLKAVHGARLSADFRPADAARAAIAKATGNV